MTLVESDRFVYLIQEYEPFTFPMGSYAALAERVLSVPPFRAVLDRVAARLLSAPSHRNIRRGRGRGRPLVRQLPELRSRRWSRPDLDELVLRNPRRLLFYARPEPHAARNMFELGVLALSRVLDDGFRSGWELRGIGTVQQGRRIALGGDVILS